MPQTSSAALGSYSVIDGNIVRVRLPPMRIPIGGCLGMGLDVTDEKACTPPGSRAMTDLQELSRYHSMAAFMAPRGLVR